MEQTEVLKPSIDQLKKFHDFYVTSAQILSQRIQFYVEEFDTVKELVEFHKNMALKIREDIEKLEPKKEENGEGSKD
jgi:hypothetical protein